MEIEAKIIEEMRKQGKTIYFLSAKVGVTEAHLWYVLKGGKDKRKLSDKLKSRIATALDIEL